MIVPEQYRSDAVRAALAMLQQPSTKVLYVDSAGVVLIGRVKSVEITLSITCTSVDVKFGALDDERRK